MDESTRSVEDIARTIERYLDEHPHAFDTARGIGEWWLHELRPPPRGIDVRRAIERLVERGVLVPVALPGGQRGYANGRIGSSNARPTSH